MTQITSMTGPVSSLRAQLRAQAEAALGTEAHKTPFTDRLAMPSAKWLLRKIQPLI